MLDIVIQPVPFITSQWYGINYSIPIVDDFTKSFSNLIYIEVIFMALSLVFCAYLLVVISKISLFHQNIIILFNVAYCWFLLGCLGRLFIIFIMLEIISEDWSPTLLFVSSLARLEYYGNIQTIQSTLAAERIFATYFVSDYEKNHRTWTLCVVIPLSTLITQLFSLSVLFLNVPLILALSYCTLMTVWSFFVINYLYSSNSRKLAHLKLNPIMYTLSKKFQLEENIRIMWYLRGIICLFLGALSLVIMFLVIPSIFGITEQIDIQSVVRCIDITAVVVCTFLPIGMFWALYHVRNPAFMRQHKMFFGEQTLTGNKNRVIPKNVDETNEYFNQFNKSWM